MCVLVTLPLGVPPPEIVLSTTILYALAALIAVSMRATIGWRAIPCADADADPVSRVRATTPEANDRETSCVICPFLSTPHVFMVVSRSPGLPGPRRLPGDENAAPQALPRYWMTKVPWATPPLTATMRAVPRMPVGTVQV